MQESKNQKVSVMWSVLFKKEWTKNHFIHLYSLFFIRRRKSVKMVNFFYNYFISRCLMSAYSCQRTLLGMVANKTKFMGRKSVKNFDAFVAR